MPHLDPSIGWGEVAWPGEGFRDCKFQLSWPGLWRGTSHPEPAILFKVRPITTSGEITDTPETAGWEHLYLLRDASQMATRGAAIRVSSNMDSFCWLSLFGEKLP
jgi:hypothetical protein